MVLIFSYFTLRQGYQSVLLHSTGFDNVKRAQGEGEPTHTVHTLISSLDMWNLNKRFETPLSSCKHAVRLPECAEFHEVTENHKKTTLMKENQTLCCLIFSTWNTEALAIKSSKENMQHLAHCACTFSLFEVVYACQLDHNRMCFSLSSELSCCSVTSVCLVSHTARDKQQNRTNSVFD